MKLSIRKILAIAVAALGIIWGVGAGVLTCTYNPDLPFAGALIFGLVAAAISVVYLLYPRFTPDKQSVEVSALPVYFSIIFVLASLVANTVFIVRTRGDFNGILILCNLLFFAIYAVLVLFAEKNVHNLSRRLARMDAKTIPHTDISAQLGIILGMAENDEVRNKLLSFKEYVDYGSNVSTQSTAESEARIGSCLDELQTMMRDHADDALIVNKIAEAEMLWKTRSVQVHV